jgi:hypothetical protein
MFPKPFSGALPNPSCKKNRASQHPRDYEKFCSSRNELTIRHKIRPPKHNVGAAMLKRNVENHFENYEEKRTCFAKTKKAWRLNLPR